MYLYLIFSLKKRMLQEANTDHFNPLVPKAHNSERQNLPFPLQTKPVKVMIGGFVLFNLRHKWKQPKHMAHNCSK